MYEKDYAEKIKQKIDICNTPILIEDSANYLSGYRRLKYYYSTKTIRNKHIEQMKADIHCKHDTEVPLYDTLYANYHRK